MTDTNTAEREAVARAIWALMREHEDRCDEELEDLSRCHPVWEYADAARASLAASAGSEPVAWPKDAAEVRAFIGSQFERLQYGKENGVPHENDRYTLTSHDLLSAFRWWSESLPSPPEGAGAEQALRKVLSVVQRYLPPDGPSAHDAMSEITAIVDPWPLGPLEKP